MHQLNPSSLAGALRELAGLGQERRGPSEALSFFMTVMKPGRACERARVHNFSTLRFG
jgi:hypothetical protein